MREMYYLGKSLEIQQAIIIFMIHSLKKKTHKSKRPGWNCVVLSPLSLYVPYLDVHPSIDSSSLAPGSHT